MGGVGSPQQLLDLVDWRRRVGDLYRISGSDALMEFRGHRDALMATHPQTPIPAGDRGRFRGIRYFPPDPLWRVTGSLTPPESEDEIAIENGGAPRGVFFPRARGSGRGARRGR